MWLHRSSFGYMSKRQARALPGQPSWEARTESGAWSDVLGVSRRGSGVQCLSQLSGWLGSSALAPRRRAGPYLPPRALPTPLTNAPLRPA